MTRLFGCLLLAVGLVGLMFGELAYRQQRHDVTFGPFVVQTVERKSIPIPPLAAAAALLVGSVLVTSPWRYRRLDR